MYKISRFRYVVFMKRVIFCIMFAMLALNLASAKDKLTSFLEIINVEDGSRRVVKTFPHQIEAPNWTPDGKWLIYNSGGKLYKISPQSPQEIFEIDTGFANSCNNDHVLSADGKQIAISHHTKEDRQSRIYILPFDGGIPALITAVGPSYLHGWSPDKKTLSYTGGRNGNYDIYTISANGGEEKRLTKVEQLDDGPEYSPDGKFIWFNSCRSGQMQIWRMNPDGTNQTQITFDKTRNSWFAHPSPDGKLVVFLTYNADEVKPDAHPSNKNVELKIMNPDGTSIKTIAKVFGGQGTINVNSWSPDSKHLAFVSYKLEKE